MNEPDRFFRMRVSFAAASFPVTAQAGNSTGTAPMKNMIAHGFSGSSRSAGPGVCAVTIGSASCSPPAVRITAASFAARAFMPAPHIDFSECATLP